MKVTRFPTGLSKSAGFSAARSSFLFMRIAMPGYHRALPALVFEQQKTRFFRCVPRKNNHLILFGRSLQIGPQKKYKAHIRLLHPYG
jgi:hypothetical protein